MDKQSKKIMDKKNESIKTEKNYPAEEKIKSNYKKELFEGDFKINKFNWKIKSWTISDVYFVIF